MPDDERLLIQAAQALVDESAVEMTTGDGGLLELWTIECDGPAVRASAPRLAVHEGMSLACRLVLDGLPHQVEATIEQAAVQSQSRAALIVRVTGVHVDGQRRQSKRVGAAVPATLTALVCDRLVPGETISATIDDLSTGGMALAIADLRPRPGDLLRVRARVFEGTIDCELRITSARGGAGPSALLLGGAFVNPDPLTAAAVTALLERLDSTRPAPGPLRLRASLAPEPAATDPAPRPTAPRTNPRLAST